MSDIERWLSDLGLDRYAPAFAAQEIDLETLPEVTDGDLEAMGLPIGPRRKILKAAAALASEPAAAPSPGGAAGGDEAGVALAAERRQLTVMFCDLVGSTALAEALDPEDLRALMAAYRKAAAAAAGRFDGRVAQYLGDGLMVYFGWPQAHEDDAQRAVRAGLDIIESVKSVAAPTTLQVRIGIATGPVVVGAAAAGGDEAGNLAVGETPNLAARLQALAEADQIVIGPGTRRLAGGAFRYKDLGARQLKGIKEPVAVWQVLGESAADGRFEAQSAGGLTPFIGRDGELAILRERWGRVRDGDGQVVLLSGEPGLGKSRLVRELRRAIEDEAHTSLRYQCSPYHTSSALHPITEQISRAAGFARDDTDADKLDKIDGLFAAAPEPSRALIGAMMSLDTGRYQPLNLNPQQQKERTLQVFLDQALVLARTTSVLAVFEDVHWADPTTQDLLDRLVPVIETAPIMMLITFRPEYTPPWSGLPHLVPIVLSRLGKDHVAAMVNAVGGDLAGNQQDQIVAKSDGVPLFVEELTRDVVESDAGDESSIPATLRDSLANRLDRLGPAKEVAQAASVLGREFRSDIVAKVMNIESDALVAGLDTLAASGLLQPVHHNLNADFRFKHALVRDTAYESLLRAARQRLHGRAAAAIVDNDEAMSPEVVARHYELGGDQESACTYWQQAGELAVDRGANEESEMHFRHALDLAEAESMDVQRRVLLVARLGNAMHVTGRRAEANQLMLRHNNEVGRVDDPVVRGQYHMSFGYVRSFLGERANARESFEAALASGREANALPLIAFAQTGLGWEGNFSEQFRVAEAQFDGALEIYQDVAGLSWSEKSGFGGALYGLTYATSWLGKFDKAAQAADRLTDLEPSLGTRGSLNAVEIRSWTQNAAGKWDAAIALLEAEFAEDPSPFSEAIMRCIQSAAYLGKGEIETALPMLESSMEKAIQYRSKQIQLWALLNLGDGYCEAGRWDQAEKTARDCVKRASEIGGQNARAQFLLGRVALGTGDFAQAHACFAEALDDFAARGMRPSEAQVQVRLGELAAAEGRPDATRDHLDRAIAIYEDLGAAPLAEKALARAAELCKPP